MASNATPVTVREAMLASQFDHTGRFTVNTRTKAASLAVAAALLAPLVATFGAPTAFASTSVTSAGTVLPGGTSGGTASFTFTENSANAFPTSGGNLVVGITDYAGGSTVHFVGTPVLAAPSSLGASVVLGPSGNFFTVTMTGSDSFHVEQITVSGLRISADAGAVAGAINATLSGSLVGSVSGGSFTASGVLQAPVGVTATAGVLVNVTSSCGFAVTGGANSNVAFADISDSRTITGATTLSGGQQTLSFGVGGGVHPIGTVISQTVSNCNGALLGSPGTVGAGSTGQHLIFVTQPGGGAAGAAWAQQPMVEVLNASNQLVTTDNTTVVTLSIATNPAGGTLSCTSGTSRTAVNGIAAFYGCSINVGSASYYTLYATSYPYWTPAISNPFLVSGSTAQQLVFLTQPGGGTAGAVWSQQPVVAVETGGNQIVATDNTTVVTLSIATNPAGGTLSCTSGTSRTAINGIVSFYGCSINVGSASTYALYATSSPYWTPATSSAFLVSAPVRTPVTLTDAIAAGVNKGTSGFGTASVVVPRGMYITVLGRTSPNLSGSIVEVWTRTKTGAWTRLTSRLVASDGTVHYYARVYGWTACWLKFAGDATHSPAASHGRVATNPA